MVQNRTTFVVRIIVIKEYIQVSGLLLMLDENETPQTQSNGCKSTKTVDMLCIAATSELELKLRLIIIAIFPCFYDNLGAI